MRTYPKGTQTPYAPTNENIYYPDSDGKPMAATDLHIGVDGGLRSSVLGLEFHVADEGLGIYDPVAREWLQTPAESATVRAETAETRAEDAETRAETAEAEAAELREQIARLRASR